MVSGPSYGERNSGRGSSVCGAVSLGGAISIVSWIASLDNVDFMVLPVFAGPVHMTYQVDRLK